MGLWRSYVVQGLSSRVERPSGRLESSVIRGQWVDPTDQTTVAEYARRWAAARPYRPTTARRVNQSIENHLAGSVIGSRRLASVRPSDVQAWAAELAKTLAPSTLALTVNMLKSIYAAAVLDRLIASSPVVRVPLPRADAARIVPLTVGQVRASSPPRFRDGAGPWCSPKPASGFASASCWRYGPAMCRSWAGLCGLSTSSPRAHAR
ncbi:MAG: hypothetical protein H0V92_12195 [Pseudonocardiales bacterium]|nr:hypothetical protein [Pseudonocardiales bacterium]